MLRKCSILLVLVTLPLPHTPEAGQKGPIRHCTTMLLLLLLLLLLL
jgi:hypothetical protein